MTDEATESAGELEQLRAECDRLRRERDTLRNGLDALEGRAESLASAQLKLLASSLSKDIKSDFWELVKRGLWIAALLASVATAGGIFTLSDMLKSRIDTAVEGKHKEIEKLREGIVGALVDVKVRAETANREVEVLTSDVATAKKQFVELKQQVEHEGVQAIASIRGVTVSVTQTVDASGQTSTKASAAPKANGGLSATGSVALSSGADWFGALPTGFVGIAGSAFNQVGMEGDSSGTSQGAFSVWFQKMLRDPSADADRNQRVSLREAVQAAAPNLKAQTPVIAGEDQALTLFSLPTVAESNRPNRKVWAILVGINKYSAKDRYMELRGPVNDIKNFARILADRTHLLATDVEVTELLNERATVANIQSSIDVLDKSVATEDVVIVYFSGHQTNVPEVSGSKVSVKALLPHDWEGARFLRVPQLVQWLGKIPAKQKILIADV